jgi:hypothetical protein
VLLGFSYAEVAVMAALFVASTFGTSAIAGWYLVAIRPDHFVANQRGLTRRIGSPVARTLYAAGKNIAGVLLILIGVVLSLPGVPGQGLLTILVGLLLLDVPGKRRFELKILRRPAVLRNVNRLRARFHKEPLLVESDAAQHGDMTVP